jgi:Secretion system C-terminal sorting domain
MNHKSLLMFLWACLVAFQLTRAQSFCLDVGDGVAGGRRETVEAMVATGADIAFVGLDLVSDQDVRTLVGKISQNGDLLWMRSFDMIGSAYRSTEVATSIIEAANGDLIFAADGLEHGAITRCRGENGMLRHSKIYQNFNVRKIFEAPDGKIIAFGGDASNQPIAVLLDESLNFVEGRRLGFYGQLTNVIKVQGGYIGTGCTPGAVGGLVVTFSLSNSLAINWVREYSTGLGGACSSGLVQLNDGSIASIVNAGYCSPINDRRIIINHYSSTGVLLNGKRIFTSSGCAGAITAMITPSGMMILAGTVDTHYLATWAFSPSGTYLGAKKHGIVGKVNALARNNQGQIFMGASLDDIGAPTPGYKEGRIMRLNSFGSSCCSSDQLCWTDDVVETDAPADVFAQTPLTLVQIAHGSAVDHGVATMICSDITAKTSTNLEEKQGSTPTLSPNPAHDQLQLDLPGDGPSELQLLDLQGRLLRRLSLPAGQHSLPVSDLESGVYLLHIQGPGGLSTHKLSIQH